MRDAGNAAVGSFGYSPVAIGGGGWVTGIKAADDGTLVCRTDTFNAYVRGPSATRWTPLLRPGDNIAANQMDITSSQPWTDVGAVDVAICATNSSVIYVYCMGYIYKTTDGGATFTRTAFTQNLNLLGNQDVGKCGNFMAVDPQNASVCYMGTDAGLYVTANGGTSWALVSTGSIPAPTSGRRIIVAFDRSSTFSGGKTQGIYVFVNGSGLYRSTDAGATWAAVASTPTTAASSLAVHLTAGIVYYAGDGTKGGVAQLRRFDPAGPTWTAPTQSGGALTGRMVVLKPSDATKVFLFNDAGWYAASTDNGATFGSYKNPSGRNYADIPWLTWTTETYMSNGGAVFDPTADRIWICEGIGVWKLDTPPTTSGGTCTITEASKGIENLVCSHLMMTPEGRLHVSCLDRAFFVRGQAALGAYPSQHGPNNLASLKHGTMQDYAIDNHNFVAGVGSGSTYKSSDGGATWSSFATDPAATAGGTPSGGNIAIGNSTNIVYLPGQSGQPVYTLDGGVTWNSCGIGSTGWISSYTHKRRVLVADKLNAGTFYLFNKGNSTPDTSGLVGVWKTTNGGVSWARVKTSVITNYNADYWHSDLKQVPGQPGHFMWSAGDGGDGLYLSTDSCVTWTKLSGTGETYKYGFGMARPGATYPPILACGYRGATYGFWLSEDAGANWTQVATFPGNLMFDWCTDIAGDPSIYGRFCIGWNGTGVGYYDFTDTAHAT